MKFKCLDGSEINVDISPSKYTEKEVSIGQIKARDRIKTQFGNQIILEEFTIPKTNYRIDFFLPLLKIAIEWHGRQHFKFIKHFHRTKERFKEQKQRDAIKAEWCRLNEIELIIWAE